MTPSVKNIAIDILSLLNYKLKTRCNDKCFMLPNINTNPLSDGNGNILPECCRCTWYPAIIINIERDTVTCYSGPQEEPRITFATWDDIPLNILFIWAKDIAKIPIIDEEDYDSSDLDDDEE